MKTKRIISLLLVVVMLFSVVSVSFASAAENSVNAVSDYVPDYDRETPVIIVHGMSQNDTYVLDENGNRIEEIAKLNRAIYIFSADSETARTLNV